MNYIENLYHHVREPKPEPTPKPLPTLPPLPPKPTPTPTPTNLPVYRLGGKTSTNLTPRVKDISGVEAGLSLTTTPGKGWVFSEGKNSLIALGFIIIPVPTETDPGYFVIQPGPAHLVNGRTYQLGQKHEN